MKKQIAFFWQWESTRPQADPRMTRERAASLLRAWRRAHIQGRRVFHLRRVRVPGTRAYLVQHVASGERGGLYLHVCGLHELDCVAAHSLQDLQVDWPLGKFDPRGEPA